MNVLLPSAQLAVIIPVFREAANVAPLVARLDTALAGMDISVESSNGTLLPLDRITIRRLADRFNLDIQPVANRSGSADVTVIVRDATDTDRRSFSVTVIAVNDEPVANFDVVQRRPGGSIKIPISQFLANDIDPEFDPVSFVDVYSPSADGGTVRRSGDWILYSPPAGGGDPFDWVNYAIGDGRGGFALGAIVITTESTDGNASGNLLNIRLEGESVIIEFVGVPGRSYHVQASSSMTEPNWVTIGTVTANRQGLMRFVEERPPGGSRYYRTLETGN